MSASSAGFPTAFVRSFSVKYSEEELERREAVKRLVSDGPGEGNLIVVVEREEWYPVYEQKVFEPRKHNNDYTLNFKPIIEVPGETVVRWKEVFDAFAAVQKEIMAAVGDDE